MLIPYFSLISYTSSITISESLPVTCWICIQLCHMGKQISKPPPRPREISRLRGPEEVLLAKHSDLGEREDSL